MRRSHQFILIVSVLIGSALGMQGVHEFGHVVGAWATGARVERVVLSPIAFSRTDVVDSSRPLVVAWAGPILGAALPLLIWLFAKLARLPGAFVLRFFAGFCLVVNGLYIGLGAFGRIGDCGEMLRHGSQPWQLWLFGAVAAPIGLLLWHGQGASFGLGTARGEVSRSVTYVCAFACAALAILGFAVGGR